MPGPNPNHPAFCQDCFCEQCWTGFYQRAGDAVPLTNGRFICMRKGCVGKVENRPYLGWHRLTPCRNGCGNGVRA